jgi:hypothetical protein
MNQFRILYIWKYHKEIPHVAILNKKNVIFFLLQTLRTGGRIDPAGGGGLGASGWGGGGGTGY